jgi:hypothetical protein
MKGVSHGQENDAYPNYGGPRWNARVLLHSHSNSVEMARLQYLGLRCLANVVRRIPFPIFQSSSEETAP